MTSRDHQDDLEWLYGAQAQQPRVSDPDLGERPRVTGDSYEEPSRPRVTDTSPRTAQKSRGSSRNRSHRPSRPRPSRRIASGHAALETSPGTPPARRRRHPLRTLAIFLLVIAVYLIGVPAHAFFSMPKVGPITGALPNQPGSAILLIGSDSRTGTDDAEEVPDGIEGSRADTIMLLYRPTFGRAVLVSVPRDSYVPIAGYGSDKLNAAYSYGGPELLTSTVENVTGVSLDGYLEIGFGGFSRLVDAVGGVEVCLDEPMEDELAQVDLPAGCQTLDGSQALGYVRMRYHDPRGDIGRAERQRDVVGKVVKKLASPETFINPVRYWKVSHATSQLVTRSEDTGILDLASGALALRSVSGGDGISLVVPIADPNGVADNGASVVIWDHEQASQLFDEISRGQTDDLDRFS